MALAFSQDLVFDDQVCRAMLLCRLHVIAHINCPVWRGVVNYVCNATRELKPCCNFAQTTLTSDQSHHDASSRVVYCFLLFCFYGVFVDYVQ